MKKITYRYKASKMSSPGYVVVVDGREWYGGAKFTKEQVKIECEKLRKTVS